MRGAEYTIRNDCRLCHSSDLVRVLELPNTPLANELPVAPIGPEDEPQQEFPLYLVACDQCGHVQLPVVVDPERLFRDYVYVSGTSPVFCSHFERYAEGETVRCGLQTGDLVVEVGSNDGTLLGYFRDLGMRVLGVDPARDIAARASADGVETLPEFFTETVAARIRREHGGAALVVANNVFAHADDLGAIVRGVKTLLAPGGAFVFEVSYLVDVLKHTLFDTIYHEHLSYHAVEPLVPFFQAHGMTVTRTQRVDTHGGSIRVTVTNDPDALEDASVSACIGEEHALGLGVGEWATPALSFAKLAETIGNRKSTLLDVLREARGRGSIAGYGAPAKATTLLRTFGVESFFDYVVDDSPLKQGRWLPGGKIPVMPSSVLDDPKTRPNTVVVLAWNFADSILARLEPYRAAGGVCVVPLPHVRTISHAGCIR